MFHQYVSPFDNIFHTNTLISFVLMYKWELEMCKKIFIIQVYKLMFFLLQCSIRTEYFASLREHVQVKMRKTCTVNKLSSI